MRLGRAINTDLGGAIYVMGVRQPDKPELVFVLKCIECGHSVSLSKPVRDLRRIVKLAMREHFDKKDTEEDEEIVRIMAGETIINIHGEPVTPKFDDKNFGAVVVDSKLDMDT